MDGEKYHGPPGGIVPLSGMRKLLGFRLLGHPTDPSLGALEIRGDRGTTTYLVTRREVEEFGTAFISLAAKMSDTHEDVPVLSDPDTFHFAPEQSTAAAVKGQLQGRPE